MGIEQQQECLDLDEDDTDECPFCGGDGYVLDDCFDDACCCIDPETQHDLVECNVCSVVGRHDLPKP